MMPDSNQCIRCRRPIDAYARICPFCNWDQSDLAAPRAGQTNEQTYVPPSENNWRRYALMTLGGIVLLFASFALGSRLQGSKPVKGLNDQQSERKSAGPVTPALRADVTFVPDPGGPADTPPVEAPITSAPVATPAQGVPPEYQRSDATAVSSVEYAQLAARAEAERKQQLAIVDPRSLSGAAYAQGLERRAPSQASSSTDTAESTVPESLPSSPLAATPSEAQAEPAPRVERTRPIPEYQPIPDVQVNETTTVRLQLTVDADGRVQDVNVLQGIPGQTPKIIATVQTWRFKPATENGLPVPAQFSTDLSFRGND